LKELKEYYLKHRQIFLFCVIGLIAVLVALGSLWILKNVYHIDVTEASFLSSSMATIVSFVLQRRVTFERKGKKDISKHFVLYSISRVVLVLLNTGGMYIFADFLRLPYMGVQLALIVILGITSWFMTKIIFAPRPVS
jgi:putative flippase GtrA